MSLGTASWCISNGRTLNCPPFSMTSGRFIDMMGTSGGRKIATNMGDLLQDRYRVTGLD